MRVVFLRAGCVFLLLAATLRLPTPALSGGMARAGTNSTNPHIGSERRDISVSWNDYWKQVEDTRQAIAELEQIPQERARLRLEGIALQFEALTSVKLPDGPSIAVDHSYLVSLLRNADPDLVRVDHLLASLLEERDSLIQGQFTASDRQALNRILAQREFQWNEQNDRQPSALEKLWRRFQQALAQLGRRLLSSQGSNYIFGIGAVVLLAAGLLFLFRNILFGFVAEARLAPRTRTGDEDLTAETALKRAQDLSHSGDYRGAVRYLYLSALLLLEERGLLGYDRTKTNREYLNSVRDQPELETPLRNVIEVFDRVWYGFQPLDDQAYQNYERQVGKLRQPRQIVQPKTEGE